MTEPVQMETVREARADALRTKARRRSSSIAVRDPSPPETMKVSRLARSEVETSASARFARRTRPQVVATGPRSSADEFDLVGGFAGRRIDGGGEELDGARNVEDLGRVIDKHHHAGGARRASRALRLLWS